jgi:hypothetical protein
MRLCAAKPRHYFLRFLANLIIKTSVYALSSLIVFILSTTNISAQSGKKIDEPSFGIVNFGNIEIVPFCLPLPTKEYTLKRNTTKAKYEFTAKGNKKYTMLVQGLMRSDESVSLEKYYHESTQGAEESGKIIQKKELLTKNRCFVLQGYWNNLIYDSRFLEIVWLRKDEVVRLEVVYPLKDSTLWNNRISVLKHHSSLCE